MTAAARAELARLIALGHHDADTDRYEAAVEQLAEELADPPEHADDWQTGQDRYERPSLDGRWTA